MKKIIVLILVTAIIMSSTITAFAYEPVSEFWPINTEYANALESKDFVNIIKYGIESMKFIENDLEDPTALEWYESRAETVGYAYERLQDYDKSAEYYNIALPLAQKRNMVDSVKVLSAKLKHFPTTLDLYQLSDAQQCYYGAVNEPQKGVYYGLPSDSSTTPGSASAMLLYVNYGDTGSEGWMNKVLTEANQKGLAVEIALNIPNEGYNFRGYVLDNPGYVDYLTNFLSSYRNVKYFVRFGAEMDIWSTRVNPEEFKQAFRAVADKVHRTLPNSAMVFSPNMVSPWDVNVDSFYPGDQYVDWVGVSLYMTKYFLGKKTDINDKEARDNEAVFGAGDFANPVACLKNLVDLYGDRKPIMISESGASHYIRPYNEDATNWAINRLKQIYNNIPMVYPQVKLIMHFDKVIPSEVNDYSLTRNNAVTTAYKELVSSPHFIQNTNLNNTMTYKKADSEIIASGNKLVLYSYANVFNKDQYKINYYVDDKYVGCASYFDNDALSETANKATLDLSSFDTGTHRLRAVVEDSSRVYLEKNYDLKVCPMVRINGQELLFDVPPEVINSRTMVPMRAIFEKLGATISWNDATQTVYANSNKRGKNLSLTIGEKFITVNGEKIEIDVPAVLKDGRTLVPLRAVSQCLGCTVDWNESEKCAYIFD